MIAVEPVAAACLDRVARGGRADRACATPGTAMAGLDCAEVSAAAWPDLRAGIAGAVTVDDAEARAAMRELAALGLAIGDCGAAALAALRALRRAGGAALGLGAHSRVLLIATEGPTDPDAYARAIGAA